MTLLKHRQVTSDEYALFHPGGKLGRSAMRVYEVMRSGDALYGVMKDTTNGRAATMNLAKEESAGTQLAGLSARVCRTAGGEYSHGICQPTTDQEAAWKSECEARGGVYFSAEYCEVPAGGLRPR